MNFRRRRSRLGMNLVGVLVAAAVMALVAAGFMRFMANATRAQGNLTKTGEASALDMTMRGLLQNEKSCLETVRALNLATLSPATQPLVLRNPAGGAMLQQGTNSNGVLIQTLEAEVFPAVRGVHGIRLHSLYRKVGDTVGGRQDFDHNYFVNAVLDAGGNVTRCFQKESQGEFQLLDIQQVSIPNRTPPSRVVAYLCNGATPWSDPAWGFEIPCNVGPGATTPPYVGPATVIRSQGNYLVFQISVGLGVFARPADTVDVVSIGVSADLLITGPGVNVSLPVGANSRGSDESGFLGTTHLTPGTPIEVTPDRDYSLQLRLYATNGGNTTQMPKVTATMSSGNGTVLHYLKSGT